MMMELMHIWGHDEQTEHSIEPRRQGYIGMGKVGEERRDDSVQHIPLRGDSKHHDHAKNQTFSDQYITRMMPSAGTRINLSITVMNKVKLPEPPIVMQAHVNEILTKKVQHN